MDASARQRLSANLVRLAAGEREVFDHVFSSLWPPLLALARRLLGNDVDAEDAAQEALLKMFGNVDQYDASRDALSWAFAITTFEARTLLKRRFRRRETSPPATELASAGSTPELDVADAELRAQLAAAIDLLTDADRQEIAAYLGLLAESGPSGSLAPARRKRRQRALARLKLMWRRLHGFHA
jgi:RNA polymerase sigma factor (sigma-70 family)